MPTAGRAAGVAVACRPMARRHRCPALPALAAVVAAVLCAGLAAGCTETDPAVEGGASAVLATDATAGPVVGRIDWERCDDEVDCGELVVPLDHDDPSLGTIELALERHPASEPDRRIGSLLVNPGGPGVSGLRLAEFAERYFAPELVARFDIVAFDPRGVGESRPRIDCVDDLDPFFALDPTPDDDVERAALVDADRAFAEACSARSGDALLANVATRDAAVDLDLIRRALGEDRISYFGFSYGSELGATWATMFPDTVRAAVLDSAAAPNADDSDEQSVAEAVALEDVLEHFLDDCGSNSDCPLFADGDPRAAYVALMAALERGPLVVTDGRPAVNEAVAAWAVFSFLYDSTDWPELAAALAAARDGDGTALLAAYDGYLLRNDGGTDADEFEALLAVNCLDAGPISAADVDRRSAAAAVAAPLIGPLRLLPYICSDWPVERDDQVLITGAGAGPILVLGATGDPMTSIDSSRQMADALEGGVLVTVDRR